MNSRKVVMALTAAIGASLAFPTQAQDGWSGEITPYFWGLGIDGDATIQGQDADFDIGYEDILDQADSGGSILGRLQYNGWLILGQEDYLSIDADKHIESLGADAELDSDSRISTLAGGYDFGDGDSGVALLVGARELSLDNELTAGGQTFSRDRDFTDTIVMAIPRTALSDNWNFSIPVAYGEGDSESTWELWPQFQYELADHWDARLGYRHIQYDIEDNDDNDFDAAFHGVTLGVGITW